MKTQLQELLNSVTDGWTVTSPRLILYHIVCIFFPHMLGIWDRLNRQLWIERGRERKELRPV